MPEKDKVDLRQCVELLTEMLENEGIGMYLFLKLTVLNIYDVFMNVAQKKKLNYGYRKLGLHLFQCDHFKSALFSTRVNDIYVVSKSQSFIHGYYCYILSCIIVYVIYV